MPKLSVFQRALIGVVLSLCSTGVMAETRYIMDKIYVDFRSGPSNENRIISNLPSGTKLDMIGLSDDETWAQVVTEGGERGWLRAQYLTDQPIARDLLLEAQRKLTLLSGKGDNLSEQVTSLEQQTNTLQTQLNAAVAERDQALSELEDIKRVSAAALDLNKRHQQLLQDHQALETKLDVANAEIDRLSDDSRQTWFLYGAIAVAIGVVLTLIVQNIRSRRRYSEWA